jgi:hypothetical protein
MVKKSTNSKKKSRKKDSSFWMSIVILVIMIASIGGFAMMTGGPQTSGDGNNGLPENLPLQKVENEGQVFWIAIKNSEVFYFMSIDGYDQAVDEKNLAEQIKTKENIDLYVDSSFESSDSIYLVEKALNGLQIDYNRVQEKVCNENTLVLTYNQSVTEGNCMIFSPSQGEASQKAEILIYHLVRN